MVLIDKFVSKLLSLYESYHLKYCDFAIVTNNCWGYKLYNSLGRQYNTPFVGLFLHPACYLKVCRDLPKYLDLRLVDVNHESKYFDNEVSYPVGHLDGIEIHFLHYKSNAECITKWNERARRLSYHISKGKKVLFQFNDRDFATKSQIKKFHEYLDGELKLSFGVDDIDIKNHFVVKSHHRDGNRVIDGVRLYDSRFHYISLVGLLHDGSR